jgi:LPPG:FO 2-phospho-L-lactate transferase
MPEHVVVLSGGVGGAKLVVGLSALLPPEALTIIVNTGDDFVHWGFHISPDVDTMMYTLSGLSHPVQGWGIADDTFTALAMVDRYGGESWFRLGDRDLGTHIARAQLLSSGLTLTQATVTLCSALGVKQRILPMSDGARRTILDTVDLGPLSFQDYFVKHRFQPPISAIRFEGDPPPSAEVLGAIEAADLIVLPPSNPYVSIDPILTMRGVREALSRKPVIGVSPIVGGKAIKGAAAKMMLELGALEPSAALVARHYGPLLSAFIVERGDEVDVPGLRVHATSTVMVTAEDKRRLAAEVLEAAASLQAATGPRATSGPGAPRS